MSCPLDSCTPPPPGRYPKPWTWDPVRWSRQESGGLTAVVAATFAVSLAFLFPDFERRNVLVPGASRMGRYTFSSVALYGSGVVAGLRWMTRSGMLPSSMFVPSLMTTAGVGLVLTVVAMMLALRRFPHWEY